MATNLPVPIFKSTGDDKRDMETFEEDLKDYCTLNNLYDPSKSTEEERWIKTDKAIACLKIGLGVGKGEERLEGNLQLGWVRRTRKNYSKPDPTEYLETIVEEEDHQAGPLVSSVGTDDRQDGTT